MNLTYDEYISFINHLFMQEFLDDSYHMGNTETTVNALSIL
jgi:hypothetical protein